MIFPSTELLSSFRTSTRTKIFGAHSFRTKLNYRTTTLKMLQENFCYHSPYFEQNGIRPGLGRDYCG